LTRHAPQCRLLLTLVRWWVTRQRPQVDRIACPWLIKRFVDPDAEFLYVAGHEVLSVAEREGATPYDHLAHIVRGADTANHDLTPESRGLLAVAQGFSLVYADDHAQLAAELPVYDALYAWCQRR
jgi:hypothetical protein